MRWDVLITSCTEQGDPATLLRKINRYSFTASFFNQAPLAGIGGDAVRIFLLYREGVRWSAAVNSAIIDRFAAAVILSLLVTVARPWTTGMLPDANGRRH